MAKPIVGDGLYVGFDRIFVVGAYATSAPKPRAQAIGQSRRVDRHPVRAAVRNSLGGAAAGNGLRLGHELLAPSARPASGRCLGPIARSFASEAACGRPHRLVTRRRRFFLQFALRDQVKSRTQFHRSRSTRLKTPPRLWALLSVSTARNNSMGLWS